MLTDSSGRAFAGTVHSLVIGQVADNRDPSDLGRVRVMFPSLAASDGSGAADDQRTAGWFRVVRPLAAQSGEFFNLPDIGDEVVVGFLDGDPEYGVVFGQLSSIGDRPHEDIYVPASIDGQSLSQASSDRGESFKNHRRVWRSREGHMIVLDDSPDAPMLQLFNRDKSIAIVFDETAEKLLIVNTNTDIWLESGRDIHLIAKENIVLDAKQKVTIEAGDGFEIKSKAGGSIEVSTTLDIKGSMINLN